MKLKYAGTDYFKLQDDVNLCQVLENIVIFLVPSSKVAQIPFAQINYLTESFKRKFEMKDIAKESKILSIGFVGFNMLDKENENYINLVLQSRVDTPGHGKIYYAVVNVINENKNKLVVDSDTGER